jgi:SulP family sulfate permease
VLLATFLLTIFENLTLGIAVGVTLGAFLFLHRMAESIEVQNGGTFSGDDQADDDEGERTAYDAKAASDADFMVYKIRGAFFFGATATVSAALDEIGQYPRTFVFDLADVPLMDTTAAKALEAFVHKLRRDDTRVFIAGARAGVRRTLLAAGLREPDVLYAGSVADARAQAPAAIPVGTNLSVKTAS